MWGKSTIELAGATGCVASSQLDGGGSVDGVGVGGVEDALAAAAARRISFRLAFLAAILAAVSALASVDGDEGVGVGKGVGLEGSHRSGWAGLDVDVDWGWACLVMGLGMGVGLGGSRRSGWAGLDVDVDRGWACLVMGLGEGVGLVGAGGVGEGLGRVEGFVCLLLGLRSFLVWGVCGVGLEGVGTLMCAARVGCGDGRR